MSNIDNSFSSLVAKLNEMSETDEKANNVILKNKLFKYTDIIPPSI